MSAISIANIIEYRTRSGKKRAHEAKEYKVTVERMTGFVSTCQTAKGKDRVKDLINLLKVTGERHFELYRDVHGDFIECDENERLVEGEHFYIVSRTISAFELLIDSWVSAMSK